MLSGVISAAALPVSGLCLPERMDRHTFGRQNKNGSNALSWGHAKAAMKYALPLPSQQMGPSWRLPAHRCSLRPHRVQAPAYRGEPMRRRRVQMLAAAPSGKQQMLVYVPSHPLVKHWLAVARNKLSPPAVFRGALAELGRLLIYEASAVEGWLPVLEGQAETPCGIADVAFLDPGRPIKVVPILRAGLVLLEQAATVLPNSQTFHVGYVRNEETLEASSYLNKLPQKLAADDRLLIVDPMLATGGTLIKVLEDIIGRGASPGMIRVVTVVCAPAALQKLSTGFPGLKVYAAMIDAELDERGYIVPGLGDAGDRAYNTL